MVGRGDLFGPRATGLCATLLVVVSSSWATAESGRFDGKYFSGQGDVEYLELLDISRRMFAADPQFQNVAMLYTPKWNGLVEGPTWGAWWIQNSYGPTYCALPFYTEPFVTFLQNAQDLWFDQMGDGKRVGAKDWVAPDGCLCDAAAPGWIVYKQGDGRTDIHDWGVEFTAAGLLMQAELLLISRDKEAAARYLPMLERCANFIESRRDPKNNLFLAGPAGNLLAPSYAGWQRPGGRYEKAYLAGLSITYIAALDRLIELEKLVGRSQQAELYSHRRALARKGLPQLMTDEGYFVKSLDPDGTRHGVYGAAKHGYFEAVCNHDAICFRVVDDGQAAKIYAKIAAIPGLRRHDLIITNHPSLDDTYHKTLHGIWRFGHWVNGGHWSTCEARMMMGYSRLGKYEDARRSMKRILAFAREFRMDNPLVGFGSAVYQPNRPINICYDTFGPPAALVRGLFEYLYRADGLTILPHIPPGITELHQRFPIRFGKKRLYLSAVGQGAIRAVQVNGQSWTSFDGGSVFLPYDKMPATARIQIALGKGVLGSPGPVQTSAGRGLPDFDETFWTSEWLAKLIGVRQHPLRIGADTRGNNRFVGDIRRARIFRRALTGEEVAALAADDGATLTGEPALVGNWLFNKADGGAFANMQRRNIRLSHKLPAKIVGKARVVDTARGKAIRLTGEGYLEVDHHPSLILEAAYTLDAWVCPKTLPAGGGRIIDKSTVGTSDNFLLDTHPGNSLRLITRQGVLSFDAKLPPDKWSHVVATFEADGELRLYVNGKQVASGKAEPLPEGAATGAIDSVDDLRSALGRAKRFYQRLCETGMAERYEAAHARLAIECFAALQERGRLLREGKLKPLPAERQRAADKSYLTTVVRLCDGLDSVLRSYEKSDDSRENRLFQMWVECGEAGD